MALLLVCESTYQLWWSWNHFPAIFGNGGAVVFDEGGWCCIHSHFVICHVVVGMGWDSPKGVCVWVCGKLATRSQGSEESNEFMVPNNFPQDPS